MTAVRLTAANGAHAAVLAALHGRCFEDAWSIQAMAEVLGSPGAFAYLALGAADGNPDQPVGFALARRTGDDAELLSLCVLPEGQRRGIGGALLDEVMRRARQVGARRLFLEVAENNEAAQALYAARGFVAGRRRPDYYRGPNRVPIAALELYCDLGT
jgi:[ribosomal protein S18]-alanine N-acetyltransferase